MFSWVKQAYINCRTQRAFQLVYSNMRVKSFIVILAITWHVIGAEFTDVLTDYESLVNVLSTYHTYDPRTKTDIREREILSYRKPLNVFPASGLALSNNFCILASWNNFCILASWNNFCILASWNNFCNTLALRSNFCILA